MERLSFGVVRGEQAGVLTSCPEDGPIDVTHHATAVGIDCRVVFEPAVWAACAPATAEEPRLAMIARDRHAKLMLERLARSLERYRDGRVGFRCPLPGGRTGLEAIAVGDELDPALMVRLS